ncbi:hypothetical protein [Nonomuraea sp. B19D2]
MTYVQGPPSTEHADPRTSLRPGIPDDRIHLDSGVMAMAVMVSRRAR